MFTNKQLKALIIPLIIEQLLAMLVGMVDVMMVSRVGEFATSGVSLVDQITFLFMQAFSAMATGGSVIAANAIGRRDAREASASALQLVVSSSLIGIIIMVICLMGQSFFIDMIYGSVEADVRQAGITYFWITGLSYPFLAMYFGESALCRAMGDSKVTMKVSILVNLVNIVGNAVMIMVLKMGVVGVAIPTVASRVIGAVLLFFVLKDGKREIHYDFSEKFRFDWPMIRRILSIGIPTGIDGSIFQVGKLILASLISTLGTAAIAANAVSNTLSGLVNVPGSAMGLAMVTIVGQCIGAGETNQAKMYTKRIMKWIYMAMIGMGIVMIVGLPWILGMYNLSEEAYASARIIIVSFCVAGGVMWPSAFALQNALRAGGDANYIMYVSIGSMICFRVLSGFLFVKVFHWGVVGIWIAMYVDWFFRSLGFVTRFISGKWVRFAQQKKTAG